MNLKILLCDWNERLSCLLDEIRDEKTKQAIKFRVENKRYLVFEVFLNEKSIGFLVCFIDRLLNDERQFVVMHALSEIKGNTPISHVASFGLDELAQRYCCKTVRIHSERRGLDKLLEKADYYFQESVFIRKVI